MSDLENHLTDYWEEGSMDSEGDGSDDEYDPFDDDHIDHAEDD